jgi:hypothetical protein
MHHVHLVWHVSQLEPAHDAYFEGHTQLPPLPIEVEGEAEHEVAGILDLKLDRQQKELLVFWPKAGDAVFLELTALITGHTMKDPH